MNIIAIILACFLAFVMIYSGKVSGKANELTFILVLLVPVGLGIYFARLAMEGLRLKRVRARFAPQETAPWVHRREHPFLYWFDIIFYCSIALFLVGYCGSLLLLFFISIFLGKK